jgi:hypothetical protein
MYDALSTPELVALQEMLYTATEKAYRLANILPDCDDWLAVYRPVHTEVARLFLEAAHELLGRLGSPRQLAHA